MRTIAHTRLFVTLTLEEAAAIGRLQPAPTDTEAIRAVDKIRSTLERTIADATSPEPSTSAVPPLRAKHYRPCTPQALPITKADLPVKGSIDTAAAAPERLRMAKATLPATARRERDDYVPYRDEADGVYT
jgi:hypothetical protein